MQVQDILALKQLEALKSGEDTSFLFGEAQIAPPAGTQPNNPPTGGNGGTPPTTKNFTDAIISYFAAAVKLFSLQICLFYNIKRAYRLSVKQKTYMLFICFKKAIYQSFLKKFITSL